MEWITYCKDIKELTSLKECGITMVMVAESFLATRVPAHFSWAQIKEINQCCDALGLKMGVMMNRIFFDEEIEECKKALMRYNELNISRIDYTDPAVFMQARQLNMEHLLNYNPDTLMCNDRDIQFYLDLKIDGVILSKEITLEEMVEIAKKTQGSLEVILFGRLNMSYSKRKLLSSYLDEIDSDFQPQNRQDLVLIETTREGKMPIVEDEHGTAIYTDYTLAGYQELQTLMDAGITRFRFDNSFLEEDCFLACMHGFQKVLHGEDAKGIFEELKKQYSEKNFDTGYMYQKTNLVK